MTGAGSDDIAYEVVRSRRATADIIIERDGSILVRAPQWADDTQVETLIEASATGSTRTSPNGGTSTPPASYESTKTARGSSTWGAPTAASSSATRKRQSSYTKVASASAAISSTRAKSTQRSRPSASSSSAAGLQRITARVKYYAPKVGVSPRGVDVRELGNRWASCSPGGHLAFHWKCMMAPQTIIDYIVVHELCHFYHQDHTDSFWKRGAGLDV
jgi:predicted metal-dependent hydrolase